MLKKTLLLMGIAVAAQGLYAETLSPEQALQRLNTSADGKKMLNSKNNPRLAFTAKDESGNPAVYVFNRGEGAGTMIVAANDLAEPLLGYTDNGDFNPQDVAPGFAYWMKEYARQISYAEAHGIAPKKTRQKAPDWTYIAPLMETQWNQMTPYNSMTPIIGRSNAPTGCVATAMAQIMNYWKYPVTGKGKLSYTNDYTQETLTMYFDREDFAWDKMLPRYISGKYTQEQADAVAYLMKACGYSTQMQYASDASGTQSQKAGNALFTYFGYDGSVAYAQRVMYTTDEWNSLIYDQLKNVGPVFYDGDSPEGGHAFVVDGFDGNGYFHLNWGWGGSSDGFYLLNALNPSQQGAGGSFGGFNYGQGIIYNIKKPEGAQPAGLVGQLTLLGSISATASDNSLTFTLSSSKTGGFSNQSLETVKATYGIKVELADGSGSPSYYACSTPSTAVTIPPGSYYPALTTKPVARFPSALADGKYKVTLMYKKTTASSYENFLVPLGSYDWVYVTKSGSKYTVENNPALKFEITGGQILTPLYYGYPCLVQYTINNPSNSELLQLVRPSLLSDGAIAYEGDTQLVSVGPNQTTNVTIETLFNRVSGKVPTSTTPIDYTLSAYDYSTSATYGSFGTVTMYRAGTLKVNMTELEITNALEESTLNNKPLFGINNYYSINVKVGLEVAGTNGYLASDLTAVISEYDPEDGSYTQVYEKNFPEMVYLRTGESTIQETWLKLENYDISKTYSLDVYFEVNRQRQKLGSVYFAADSGVDGVADDADALRLSYYDGALMAESPAGVRMVKVYDVSGAVVESVSAGGAGSVQLPMQGFNPGILIVVAEDCNGSSKVMKIRK